MWSAFVFQGLNAPLCPQLWQRFSGAVGQTKLHHKQRYPSQNLGTQARRFQDKGDWSVDVRAKGEVKGGGTEKTERERQTDLKFPSRSTHYLGPNDKKHKPLILSLSENPYTLESEKHSLYGHCIV